MSQESFKVVEFYGTKYRVNMNNEGQPISLKIMRDSGEWDKMTMPEIQAYCGYVYEQARRDGLEMPNLNRPYVSFGETPRGFGFGTFTDRYDQLCSIEKSSLGTEHALWLGVINTGPEIKGPNGDYNQDVKARMHLTQAQVSDLLPILMNFVMTGEVR